MRVAFDTKTQLTAGVCTRSRITEASTALTFGFASRQHEFMLLHTLVRYRNRHFLTLQCTLLALLIPRLQAQSNSQLPEGKGRETVEKMCGGACHDLEVVTSERLSKQGWTNTVDTMISRGATGTDEEIAAVIDYLAEHFGREKPPESATASKINVNTETAKQLAADLAIAIEEAQAIVDYREKEGKFKNWDDLKKVPRVDTKKLESKKDRIVF